MLQVPTLEQMKETVEFFMNWDAEGRDYAISGYLCGRFGPFEFGDEVLLGDLTQAVAEACDGEVTVDEALESIGK